MCFFLHLDQEVDMYCRPSNNIWREKCDEYCKKKKCGSERFLSFCILSGSQDSAKRHYTYRESCLWYMHIQTFILNPNNQNVSYPQLSL